VGKKRGRAKKHFFFYEWVGLFIEDNTNFSTGAPVWLVPYAYAQPRTKQLSMAAAVGVI